MGASVECDGCTNIQISNNYIESSVRVGSRSSASIRNNVIRDDIRVNNTTLVNNILIAGSGEVEFRVYDTGEPANNSSSNNFGDAGQFGTENGNGTISDTSAVFLGSTAATSTDGHYQLQEGSSLKTAGLDGAEVGMFGGSTPYVLSGIPSIPAIYFFEAPVSGSTTSGLPVHLKVKSRN